MPHNFAHLREHIEKLYAFSIVAKAGSLSQAAANLKISQAGLSHSLKVLEGALRSTLFIRSSKGMSLTPAGELLFEYSKRLFHDLEAIETAVKNPHIEGIGRLRIGTHETLAIHVWPEFLNKLGDSDPHLLISLMSGRVGPLVQGLKSGDYHVIVTVEPTDDPLLIKRPLYQGDFGFFVASSGSTRFASLLKKRLSHDNVDQIPILTDALAEIRQNLPIPTYLVQNGFKLDNFFELNSFEAAIQLASRGLGIAFLPRRNAAAAVKAGRLRQVFIDGVVGKGFGSYQICVTYLKTMQDERMVARVLPELEGHFT